jgi:hypothetical protein
MGDIKGTFIDAYFWENGSTTIPRNSAETTIAALVPQLNGSFAIINSEIQTDGSFQIKDPGGSYYLNVSDADGSNAPTFYWISDRVLELGTTIGRRPDAQAITISPTEIILDATGLNPWQDTDRFEIYSLGAGVRTQTSWSDYYMAGSTTINKAALDISTSSSAYLIDGSKGDIAYVTQLTSRDLDGFLYNSVGKVLDLAPFAMTDGNPSNVNGTFKDVTQKNLSIDWKRSEFEALASEVHSSAAPIGMNLSVLADRATLLSNMETGFDDLTGDLSFGNPFSGDLDVTATTFGIFSMPVMLPGAVSPTELFGITACTVPVSGSGPVVLEPAVHPVKNVKVNGLSTEEATVGVGLSPTVSWDASSTSGPVHYTVSIRKLDPASPSDRKAVALIVTAETSAVIPEGILSAGGFYFFQVGTRQAALDLTKRSEGTYYGCSAQAFTNLVEP